MKCMRREYRQCLCGLLTEENRGIVKIIYLYEFHQVANNVILLVLLQFFNNRMGLPVFN